jgi:hypothetical protein
MVGWQTLCRVFGLIVLGIFPASVVKNSQFTKTDERIRTLPMTKQGFSFA